MAKKWSELQAKMSPESRERSVAIASKMIAKMPLHELRAARKHTQVQLAQSMHISQASVSKMERNTDMYLSTLRNFVSAMGGAIKIIAVFPDGQIEIDQFNQIGEVVQDPEEVFA